MQGHERNDFSNGHRWTMNGWTGNMASGAPERPEQEHGFIELTTARRMLPLVRRVVEEIIKTRQEQAQLVLEQEGLDRKRRGLDWPGRQRRYHVHEEVAGVEGRLNALLAELQSLKVVLLDADTGRVGFPTAVNNRPAYFSWTPGEAEVTFWHFAGEDVRRPIPKLWAKVGSAT
jgi:hypothetical protein